MCVSMCTYSNKHIYKCKHIYECTHDEFLIKMRTTFKPRLKSIRGLAEIPPGVFES